MCLRDYNKGEKFVRILAERSSFLAQERWKEDIPWCLKKKRMAIMKNQLKMDPLRESKETVKSYVKNHDSLEFPSINHFCVELWRN